METWLLSTQWLPKRALIQQPLDFEMAPGTLEQLTQSMQQLDTSSEPTMGPVQSSKGKKGSKAVSYDTIVDDTGLGGESEGEDIEDDGDDLMTALKMDEYSDDDDDDDDGDDETILTKFLQATAGGTGETDLVDDGLGDDDEDDELNQVNPDDSVLLIGHTVPGEDECFIEVHCYNNTTNALYIHHDIQIPAPPISLAYMNMNPHLHPQTEQPQHGAFLAVGMMAPGIEIWNLDVMHPVEPVAVLGGYDFNATEFIQAAADISKKKTTGKKKAPKIEPQLKPNSHTDNVTSLSWHPQYPSRLLSGSNDKTVKLWNIVSQECVHTYNHHQETVPIVQFNHLKPEVFLSASEDLHVTIVDLTTNIPIFEYKPAAQFVAPVPAAPKKAPVGKKLTKPTRAVPITLETARWNMVNPNLFYVTRSDGSVQCFDIRVPPAQNPLWSINASTNGKPIPALALSQFSETLFVTVGEDGHVKVWDLPTTHQGPPLLNDGVKQPTLLTSRHVDVGRLFTVSFDVQNPFVIACGGDGGCPAIWDLMENIHVNARYKSVIEQAGFGDQSLPEDHIQLQRSGFQSKGIGPGRAYRGQEESDYDSDDEFEENERMELGGNDEDDESDDDGM